MRMMDSKLKIFSSISVDYDHHFGNRGGLPTEEVDVDDGGT